jgi:hypothetical protein
MHKCFECGADQLSGTLFCSECGAFLEQKERRGTGVLPFSEFAFTPPPPPLSADDLLAADDRCKSPLSFPAAGGG